MTRAYDELSRVMDIVGAEGQTTHLDYDVNSNATQTTNPRDFATQQAYDPLDRLSQTTDADNGITQFTYDDQDRLTSVTDANGNATTYVYDAFDNVTHIDSPDTGLSTYAYDSANNRTGMTDARNITANYTYDALNRLTSVVYPSSPTENITYTYDDTDNSPYGVGRLTGITDNSGSTAYRYDHRGNLIEQISTVDGQAYTTAYSYDVANNLTSLTYPSGQIIRYRYDTLGRISAMTRQLPNGAETAVIESVSYLPFGPVANITYGNGISADMSHNQDYRLTQLQAQGTATTAVLDLAYSYDANGNISQLEQQDRLTIQQLFGYDPLDRLAQAESDTGDRRYTYDPVGNRLSQQLSQGTALREDTYNLILDSNQLATIDRSDGSTSGGNPGTSTNNTPGTPIIVDNLDSNTSKTGSWRQSGAPNPYNNHSEYSGGRETFTWTANLPSSGDYEVQVRWTSNGGRNSAASYGFNSNAGTQVYTFDQRNNGGEWQSLGIHNLAAGGFGITLSSNSFRVISADAIQLIPQTSDNGGGNTGGGDNGASSSREFILDEAGNTLVDQRDDRTLSTTYNAANRPDSLTITEGADTHIVNYRYNALGQRVSKSITVAGTSETTHYQYSPAGQLLAEQVLGSTQQRDYLWLNGQSIAITDITTSDGSSTNTGSSGTPGSPIIVDNLDSNTSKTGAWRQSGAPNPYNNHSEYAGAGETFTWTASLPSSGDYEVQVRWTANGGRNTAAAYDFTSSAGLQTTLVNQRINGGEWQSLGVHTLTAGSFDVTLRRGGGSFSVLSADAIQVIPQGGADTGGNTGSGGTAAVIYYTHNDHLNTPRVLTNEGQDIVWQASYTPFGEASVSIEDIVYNVRFPGQYFDEETGLHYNWFRYYDPTTGRYTQSDPIGLDDGPNTYSYVANNPLIYFDPNGLEKLNLFNSPGTSGNSLSDNLLHEGAQNYKDKLGVLSVFGHGSSQHISDDRNGTPNNNPLTAQEFAELLSGSGLWNPGMPIELISCNIGEGGKESFAQSLSNILNVPVSAPDDYIHLLPNGNTRIGLLFGFLRQLPIIPGEMKQFSPLNDQ